MNTIVPKDRYGHCEVQDEEGRRIASATARPSVSRPGYVTLIIEQDIGKAIRVPADWLAALAEAERGPE